MDALEKWKKEHATNPRFVIGLEVGVFNWSDGRVV